MNKRGSVLQLNGLFVIGFPFQLDFLISQIFLFGISKLITMLSFENSDIKEKNKNSPSI